MTMALQGNDWLVQTIEPTLEPEIPICDPYHHFWEYWPEPAAYQRYLLKDLVDDINSGHNVRATVFIEARSSYHTDSPEEMRSVGEVEFVDGMAVASATRQYGSGRVGAGIIGRADLKLGERVKPVLEALQAASPNRFRGLRHSVGWDPHPEAEDQEIYEKCEADPIIGSDCPSPGTNSIWIKKEFKPNHRPLGSEEDDVVDLWSEQPDGPFDHERFKTWTVLAYVADEVMDRYAFLDPTDHHHQK